jgi:predicted dehydrogenase
MLVAYRTGDMWAPQLDSTEALKTETRHFVNCVQDGAPVITDGQSGLRVVRILEAAAQSLLQRGRLIELNLDLRTVA